MGRPWGSPLRNGMDVSHIRAEWGGTIQIAKSVGMRNASRWEIKLGWRFRMLVYLQ